ncbi:MAG: hypothetical protein ACSHWW_00160 [Nonlabens sp.]|uniref:hypothetical protein n=1 Tax=Nonlabens sp. TaxID=1888209 RepID=UPI003EF2218C
METRKPIKATLLFTGIFLVGIILVILLVNKALDTNQAVDIYENATPVIENTSQARV